MNGRQTIAGLIPLAAVVISLAEYLLDHTSPRYTSPTFWLAIVAVAGLLVAVQVLRFGGARRTPATKPDYSATTLIRRRTEREE